MTQEHEEAAEAVAAPNEGAWERVIFHVDMDAFYASIEVRDNPRLRGKPVIVGGASARGVVATASYEARKYGVHSAMPGFEARRLCPDGVFVKPRMSVYREVSRSLMGIFGRYSDAVQALSLDEAYLDMTGSDARFGPPDECADALKVEIRRELGITASIGIASNKMIAKIASDMQKPDGLTICRPGRERAFLAPLKVSRIHGVGPRTSRSLRELGYEYIGQIASADPEMLGKLIGSSARRLHELAHGIDGREVVGRRERKSIGSERTYRVDVSDRRDMRARLRPLADDVAATLHARATRARGIRLKIKFADFQNRTRERTLRHSTVDADEIYEIACELLDAEPDLAPVRLLGVTATRLLAEGVEEQASLLSAGGRRQGDKS